MAQLPYSRVIDVSVSRTTTFPSRRGFGTPLVLFNMAIPSGFSGAKIKSYATIDEVVADFATTTAPYKIAQRIFSQSPRPIQLKFGSILATVTRENDFETALSALRDEDDEWYWLIVPSVYDVVLQKGAVKWTETQRKFCLVDTTDTRTESASAGAIAADFANLYERSAVCYHTSADAYLAGGLAAVLSAYDFDVARSAYSAKFHTVNGVSALNKTSSVIQKITGFTPKIGQSANNNSLANTVVNIGGVNLVVEGSTLKPNVFIDEIHSSDWLVSRTEELLLALFVNEARVPYTDAGMQQIAGVIRTAMEQGRYAGLLADSTGEDADTFQEPYIIRVPSIYDATQSQRRNRIAPTITCEFRYAGALHYSTIRYSLSV